MKVKQNLRMLVLHGLVLAGFSLLQGCATGESPVCWLNWPYNTPAEQPLITSVDNGSMMMTNDDDLYLPPIVPVDPIDPTMMDPIILSPISPVTPAVEDHVYVVEKGDTLSGIASMYGTSWKKLADYNGLSNPNKLFVNQEVRVPGTLSPSSRVTRPTSSGSPAPSSTAGTVSVSNPIAQGSSYVIQRGDTLSGIAKRSGLSVAELQEANALDGYTIVAGKSLSIPKNGEVKVPAVPTTSTGMPDFAPIDPVPDVSGSIDELAPLAGIAPVDSSDYASVYRDVVLYPGETLEDTARQYNTTVEEILLLNGLSDPDSVKPGTKLLIPVAE